MDLMEIMARNLRRARHDKKLTQEELADRAGLSMRYVGAIERGEFPLLPIEATARALIGAPLEQLVWEATFGPLADAGTQSALLVRGLPRLEQISLAVAPAPNSSSPALPSEPVAPGTLRITTLRPPASH